MSPCGRRRVLSTSQRGNPSQTATGARGIRQAYERAAIAADRLQGCVTRVVDRLDRMAELVRQPVAQWPHG